MKGKRTRNVIVILSLLIALVMALQVLLQGSVSFASADKKTLAEVEVTNKDVTFRVPYSDASVFLSALVE